MDFTISSRFSDDHCYGAHFAVEPREGHDRNDHIGSSDHGRPQALARPRHRLHGDAHEHARRLGRQRRAARHPARPEHRAGRPHVGHQRLPDLVRQLPPARRAPRRPRGPQARLPERRDAVHARLGAVRPRRRREGADRRALHPGPRRRGLLVGDHRDDRLGVPRAGRARQGHERLHLRRRRRRLDRPARRRPRHERDQLALDLLPQHPDRRRHAAARPRAARGERGHRPRQGRRRARLDRRSPSR